MFVRENGGKGKCRPFRLMEKRQIASNSWCPLQSFFSLHTRHVRSLRMCLFRHRECCHEKASKSGLKHSKSVSILRISILLKPRLTAQRNQFFLTTKILLPWTKSTNECHQVQAREKACHLSHNWSQIMMMMIKQS